MPGGHPRISNPPASPQGNWRRRFTGRRGSTARQGPASTSPPAPQSAAQSAAQPPNRAPVDAVIGPLPRDHAFGSLQISEPVHRAITEMGYTGPTPIQLACIPLMLDGRDVVGQAQTGTGKTAGFGIPLAELVDGSKPEVQVLIMVPTRELAVQVTGDLQRICKYRGINVLAVYGGQPIARQVQGLRDGAQIVVGTPGRVIDHLDRGTMRIDHTRIAILDEADEMLDIGFAPDIRRILSRMPARQQTALFTATIPTLIRRLIHLYLKNPQFILVGGQSAPVDKVRQLYCEVATRDKLDGLQEIFAAQDKADQTLIFCRTQGAVDRLIATMGRKGYAIEGIHGGMPQSKRDSVMQDFRDGKLKVLVATNLASRGLDVPAVSHIVNYDIPDNVEEYVHRIGRTARMGREGSAMTFVSEWDMDAFDTIKKHVGEENLEKFELTMYKPAR